MIREIKEVISETDVTDEYTAILGREPEHPILKVKFNDGIEDVEQYWFKDGWERAKENGGYTVSIDFDAPHRGW